MNALSTDTSASVDLYWIPLGAGGHSVRLNGHVSQVLHKGGGVDELVRVLRELTARCETGLDRASTPVRTHETTGE